MQANGAGRGDARELTYATHSGFGNQVQALLAGLFVASQANRTLVPPPLLSRAVQPNVGGLHGRSCKPGLRVHKQKVSRLAQQRLTQLCATHTPLSQTRGTNVSDAAESGMASSWSRIFDFGGHRVRPWSCERDGGRCRLAEADLHLGPPELNAQCTRLLNCSATLTLGRGVRCTGPLDDWAFSVHGASGTVLGRCVKHALARTLQHRGLPPHPCVLAAASALWAAWVHASLCRGRLCHRPPWLSPN